MAKTRLLMKQNKYSANVNLDIQKLLETKTMSNKKSTKDKISISDIQNLEQELEGNMAKDRVYWLRNDAKLRAVYTSQSYDEFRDIVDAAHLQPLEKKDRLNSASHTTVWNSVTNKKDEEECE